MQPIDEVAAKIGISPDQLLQYGPYKAEAVARCREEPSASASPASSMLVTAINPTPAGEGKTTTTVGLGDGLNAIGKKAVICLREPSLGPCFGVKGGAAGGGYAQIVPMEDINLHFTGDFHAIAAANNLLAAMVDNHIYWGNELRHRRASRHLEARRRHERPRAAPDHQLAGRPGQRLSARRRLRHRGGLGSDGDLLPRHEPRRSHAPPRQHHRGAHARQEADLRARPAGRRRDDGAAAGCADAEPGADAGRQPGVRARRSVREHRARLQQRDGHADRPAPGRLRRHRSGLRRGPGRREVPRHQVPQGGPEARCGR